jgi:hypothetical protein
VVATAAANRELDNWLELGSEYDRDFWFNEAARQGKPLLSKDATNPIKISENVNPLPLLKQLQRRFPLICRLAAKILAIPAANSFQERAFSFATWIDTEYRQRVNDDTFERNVMLKVNGPFLEQVGAMGADTAVLCDPQLQNQRLKAFYSGQLLGRLVRGTAP